MFLFLILFVNSLRLLTMDVSTGRTFRYMGVRWIITSWKEVWEYSGDVEWTLLYEADTPNVHYSDERWCMKCNGRVNLRHVAKVCKYQTKRQKEGFVKQ